MSAFSGIKVRSLLPVFGVGLVVLVNYGVHRVRPALERQESLAATLAGVDVTPLEGARGPSGRDLRLLETQIAQLERRLERARPLATPNEAADLHLCLAALATSTGLRVTDTAPLAPAPLVQSRTQDSPQTSAQRPRQEWRLVGSYVGLQGFVAGLEELPWRVVLSDLAVKRTPRGELEIRCKVTL